MNWTDGGSILVVRFYVLTAEMKCTQGTDESKLDFEKEPNNDSAFDST